MSGPLGNKQIPPIDKKEYIRLDSNNRIPDVPDPRLFASFLTRDFNITDEEKESAKNIIIELIKDTFVNKATLNNYALNSDLQNYQPKGKRKSWTRGMGSYCSWRGKGQGAWWAGGNDYK